MNRLTPNQQKALNYNNHISLTANAGSGKTFVLSKRFVEIALKEKTPLNRIVAITFTDKAASELYKKISEHIEELLNNSINNLERKQLKELRRQLISSNISTIHSFCLNILREFPVEAKLDANFIPIDEKLSTELVELSSEKTIKDALNIDGGERIKKLIRMFSSKNTLASELQTLVKNFTKTLFIEDKIYGRSPKKISEYYDKIILEYFEKIIGGKLDRITTNLRIINQTVLENKRDNELALKVSTQIDVLNNSLNVIELIQVLSKVWKTICTKVGKILIRGYLKKDLRSNIEQQCCEVESTLEYLPMFFNYGNENSIWSDLSLFGGEMLYYFRKCLNLYEEYKTDNGYLDYEDILYKTFNILKNPVVSNFLSEKYNYLMIDEYQDTNEIQYNIFLPLLDNLKKGNLFVVGDEKQSIYMFREAEIEIFRRTKEDIAKVSGEESQLKLPDSFRMRPELCLFTNKLFRNVFNDPDPLFNEVNSSDLICAQLEGQPGNIEILFYNQDSDAENSESELVAKRIINLMIEGNGKYSWGNIAILCRKRKSFSELEKILAEFNVPCIIMGGKDFFQRQSVYDIYNYFSFMLDNSNDSALVGLLRSPFFSLSDDEIFQISQTEGKTYWGKIEFLKNINTKWNKVYSTLNDNIILAEDIDFSLLLRKILKESSFIPIISSRPDGTQETSNIEKLVSLTSNFRREGYRTLYDYVNYLKESILEKEDEPQASMLETSDSVKIMTIHQSKGLEFPIVVLYKCNDIAQKNFVKTKSVIVDKYFGLLTKMPKKGNYYSPYQSSTINEISNYIIGKKEYAEIKRLFYVGVTRAREHLIMSFESNDNFKLSAGSFINILRNALEVDFNNDFIEVEGYLDFLVNNDDNYVNIEKNILLKIPIIRTICQLSKVSIKPNMVLTKTLKTSLFADIVSGEIISATKYSIFNQCPLRYFYQYELGMRTGDKKFINIEENQTSERNVIVGILKGRIIHSLLEDSATLEEISKKVKIKIEKEKLTTLEKSYLIEDIIKDLKIYYASKIYKEINSAENYKNEYELYIRKDDFYLQGRLDKLIFNDDKIKIIDYKTDKISPSELKSKGDQYLSQLKFYAYILNSYFVETQIYELQVVFIKNPELTVQFQLNKLDLILIKQEIVKMMESLKTWNFIKNVNYCTRCDLSVDKLECIKEN